MRICSDPSTLTLGGDGRWHRLEECDDGNQRGGDGCSANCTVEDGYSLDGSGEPLLDDVPLLRVRPPPRPALRDS
jgi:cysteine-rich repeat protein